MVNNPEVPKELTAEQEAVAKIKGVNYFNNGSDQVPKQENLDRFFKIMDNEENYPVLIHCYHGVGRAEMYSAIYRIEYEGWSNEDARKGVRTLIKWSSLMMENLKENSLKLINQGSKKILYINGSPCSFEIYILTILFFRSFRKTFYSFPLDIHF